MFHTSRFRDEDTVNKPFGTFHSKLDSEYQNSARELPNQILNKHMDLSSNNISSHNNNN